MESGGIILYELQERSDRMQDYYEMETRERMDGMKMKRGGKAE